jgi:Zn-dependent protease
MIWLLASDPLAFLILAIGLLISFTFHEFAHAWMADHLGDPTPRSQGRLTLNPAAHLDPMGTLAILIAGFGWGKPVEFDPYNLQHPVRDSALIAMAGPAANIIMAIGVAILMRVIELPDLVAVGLFQLLVLNISLAVFNLIPVAPLDGSKLAFALLPPDSADEYADFMNRYGTMILIALILPLVGGRSAISYVVSPIVQLIVSLLIGG